MRIEVLAVVVMGAGAVALFALAVTHGFATGWLIAAVLMGVGAALLGVGLLRERSR